MKALIYGHSQAQPTGMGDDMLAALKKLKVTVKRLGLQGRNDKQLLQQSGQLGNISPYDVVFLYCGGNNSNIPDTLKLIQHFGPQRVIAILPPLNIERTVPDMTLEQRRARAAEYRSAVRELVPVYQIEGVMSDFKKDQIHLRTGTTVGKNLVQSILEDMKLVTPQGASATPAVAEPDSGSNTALWVGLGAAALLGVFLFLRRR